MVVPVAGHQAIADALLHRAALDLEQATVPPRARERADAGIGGDVGHAVSAQDEAPVARLGEALVLVAVLTVEPLGDVGTSVSGTPAGIFAETSSGMAIHTAWSPGPVS